MDLSLQKKLAAEVLKCSYKRVIFNPERLQDISAAITKEDIRKLIDEGAIVKLQKKGVSRARAKKIHAQKKKARRIGPGSKKGKRSARIGGDKRAWINKVRSQRRYIAELKEKGLITKETYKKIYDQISGGFFRSRKHIQIYLQDSGLFVKKEQ